MGKMKNLLLLTAGALLIAGAAPAQEFRTEPSQFIEAKLAASEGHFDQALSLIDKVIATDPNDPVLLFERASMLLDAGKADRGEASEKAVAVGLPSAVRLDDVERDHILHVMEQTFWRVEGEGGAAEILGLNPGTLRSRLKKLGLQRPSSRR